MILNWEQFGPILREHLAMGGDIVGCHSSGQLYREARPRWLLIPYKA
jgi:hypothetical protein